MSQPLILYDTPNKREVSQRCWSPNCWKARYVTCVLSQVGICLCPYPRIVLNYKHISYKTVWVDYADVQPTLKAIGAEPSTHYADGSPRYTVPTIFDPNTNKFVTDSLEIAKYLDLHYAERPVFPQGSEEDISKFVLSFIPAFGMVRSPNPLTASQPIDCVSQDLLKIAGYRSYHDMEPRGQAALERVILGADQGPPLAERIPDENTWKGLEQAFTRLAEVELLNKHGRSTGSDSMTFADLGVASFLQWLRLGVTNEEFERVLQWNGGRWKTFIDEVQPYLAVDEGEPYQLKA
jgi:glutathione S-transferase